MIIFQHDHTGKIMAMWIDSADEHAILLNQPKAFRVCECADRKQWGINIPGVVLRVPATVPLYPYDLARSFTRFDLYSRHYD